MSHVSHQLLLDRYYSSTLFDASKAVHFLHQSSRKRMPQKYYRVNPESLASVILPHTQASTGSYGIMERGEISKANSVTFGAETAGTGNSAVMTKVCPCPIHMLCPFQLRRLQSFCDTSFSITCDLRCLRFRTLIPGSTRHEKNCKKTNSRRSSVFFGSGAL